MNLPNIGGGIKQSKPPEEFTLGLRQEERSGTLAMQRNPFPTRHLTVYSLALFISIALKTAGVAQAVTEVSGTVSGQWTRAASPYLVINDTTIETGQTLEIEAGVTVLFRDSDDDLFINGTLRVNGTEGSPVRFSSDELDQAPGQWGALIFGEGSDQSVMNHAIVEYGGSFRNEQVQISDSAPTLRSNTIRFGRSTGLGVYDGKPLITGSHFVGNLGSAASISADANPDITGSRAEDNGSNTLDLSGGTLAGSALLTRDNIPYRITNDLSVPADATLTIQAGTTIQFRDRDDDLFVSGTLIARGNLENPIRFTSDDLERNPDQWGSIVLGEGSDESVLEHATIEYGGGFRNEQLQVSDSSPTLRSLTIQFGRSHGLGINNGRPVITNTRFVGNLTAAAIIATNANPDISSSEAEGNGSDTLDLSGGTLSASSTWTLDRIPYRIINDISVPIDTVLTIEAGNTIQFRDSDDDLFIAGTLVANAEPATPITFTSDEQEKAPNQWGSIVIQSLSKNTQLRHCRVEFGGGFSNEQFKIDRSSPTLENISFVGSRSTGLGISGGQPIIRNVHFSENLGYAATATTSAFPILSGLSAEANGFDAVGRSGGSLEESGTWTQAGIPYTITNDITVPENTLLTVAEGTTVQFQDRDDDLWIQGGILARGTSGRPIRFTSNEAAKAPNQWGAVIVGSTADDDNTVFEHCIFEFGGGSRSELLQINDASPTIAHSRFQHSRVRGITLSQSQATITDTVFNNNEEHAAGMDPQSIPTWDRNSAIENAADSIAVFGGSVQVSGEWKRSTIPYTIVNDVTIEEAAHLKIAAGNIIQFRDTDDDLWVSGSLEAIGTTSEPIHFTSDNLEKAPGQWGAVLIGETARSEATELIHCQFSYGGGFRSEIVLVTESAPTISNCTFHGSRAQGLTLNNSRAVVTQCHFSDNQTHAFGFNPPSFLRNSGNTAAGNGSDSIGIVGGEIPDNVVWANDTIPYTILNDITVAEGALLTIQPGTTVQFRDTDDDLWIEGNLLASGTTQTPIRFTSDNLEKAPGQWGAIIFQSTVDGGVSSLQNAIVEYGSGFRSGMVQISDSLPSIRDVEFQHSRSHGIALTESAPTLEHLVFHDNLGSGIHTSSGATPAIRNNSFFDNGQAGVTNSERSLIVDATNNYWGDASGPKDTRDDDELAQINENSEGDAVSEYVRWRPFLSEPPNAARPQLPRIALNTLRVDFGETAINQTNTQLIRITNQGNGELTITSVSIGPDSFRTSFETPVTIAPTETIDLGVSFHPQVAGEVMGSIAIVSTDSSEPSLSVALTGVGINPNDPAGPIDPNQPLEPGTPVRITFDSNDEQTPVWHPADNRIAFATNRTAGDYNDLGMVNADGTDERLIASGPQSPFGIAPFGISWVGDTDFLMTTESVFLHEYLSFDTTVAPYTRSDRDGDDGGFRRRLLIDPGGGGELFTVSRDGSTALWRFSTRGGRGDVSLRSAPFITLTGQSAQAIGTVHITESLPDFSPPHIRGASLFSDGSQFIVSLRSGEGYDLFRYSTTGAFSPIQLTTRGETNGAWHNLPQVSPDDSTVAFAFRDPTSAEAQTEIYTLDLEAGAIANVTQTPNLNESHPSWSPDGTRLVYQRADTVESGALREGELGNWNLYVIALDGSIPTNPNEPVDPPVDPPVEPPLPLPEIQLSTVSVKFEPTELGSQDSRIITISNTGSTTLTIDGVQASAPFEALLPSFPLNISPDQTAELTVVFTPTSFGEVTGTQILSTNDPSNPEVEITLSGTGIELIVPTPRIESLSPNAASLGELVVLRGAHFSNNPGENQVFVGTQAVPTTTINTTELHFQIPNETPSGTLPVTVSVGDRLSNAVSLLLQRPVPVTPPHLEITQTDNQSILLTWLDPAGVFTLQSKETIFDEEWNDVTEPVEQMQQLRQVRVSTQAGSQFFRLVENDSLAPDIGSLSIPTTSLPADWEPSFQELASSEGIVLPTAPLELSLATGGSLRVPVGSVPHEHTLRISELDLSRNSKVSRRVYRVETDADRFSPPVSLHLPAPEKADGDLDQFTVYRYDSEQGVTELNHTFDPTSGLVNFTSDRFSTIVIERHQREVPPESASRILSVPFYPQADAYWCFAASSQMMFKYYGRDVEIWDIGRYFKMDPVDGPTILGLYSGSYTDLFEAYGLSVRDWSSWIFIPHLIQYLRQEIDAGRPIMLWVRYAAHAVVVVGYDEDGIYLHDPSGFSIKRATGAPDTAETFANLGQFHFTWDEFFDALFGREALDFRYNIPLPVWTLTLDDEPAPPVEPVTFSLFGLKKPNQEHLRIIRPSEDNQVRLSLLWQGLVDPGYYFPARSDQTSPPYPVNDDELALAFTVNNMSSEPKEFAINATLNGQPFYRMPGTLKIPPFRSFYVFDLIAPNQSLPIQSSPERVLLPGNQKLLFSLTTDNQVTDWIPVTMPTGPSAPRDLRAVSDGEAVALSWTEIPESTVADIEYQIFVNDSEWGTSGTPTFRVIGAPTDAEFRVMAIHPSSGLVSTKTAPIKTGPPTQAGRWVLRSGPEIHGPVFASGNPTTIDRLKVSSNSATVDLNGYDFTITWATPPSILSPNDKPEPGLVIAPSAPPLTLPLDQKQPFPGWLKVTYTVSQSLADAEIPDDERDGTARAFIGYQEGPCTEGSPLRCQVLERTNTSDRIFRTIGGPRPSTIIDDLFGNGGLRDQLLVWVRVRANQANERGVSNELKADVVWRYSWEE